MLYSAFVVGLLGSVHCLGMCGPLVMALPTAGNKRRTVLRGRLMYHTGRILTYAGIGFLAGTAGQSLAWATSGQSLSVMAGVLMLAMLAIPSRYTRSFAPMQPLVRFTSAIKKRLGVLLQQRTLSTHFILGALNGLLPCGLIYAAMTGALVTGSSTQGALYMALFGLGTLPVMLTASLSGQFLSVAWRARFSRLAPGFAWAIAGLLILRGLNLGIPGLSPRIEAQSAGLAPPVAKITCHRP